MLLRRSFSLVRDRDHGRMAADAVSPSDGVDQIEGNRNGGVNMSLLIVIYYFVLQLFDES